MRSSAVTMPLGRTGSVAWPMSLMLSRMMRYLTPDCAMTSRSKRARALGPVTSLRMRLPPMPSLSTERLAVFLLASRRRASSSGQRALALLVVKAPSVMLSPRATTAALSAETLTSTPLMKGQEKISVGESSASAPATLPGAA